MDRALYSADVIAALGEVERKARVATREMALAEKMGVISTQEELFARSHEIVKELRSLGHDLWSFDSDGLAWTAIAFGGECDLAMTAIAELRRCVQALAQPALVQVSLFPEFAVVGDELALQFDDALRAYSASGLTAEPSQLQSLKQLDDYLAELSGPENERFWLDRTVLFSDARWHRIRDLARAVLASFNWPDETPPRDGATYVGGCEIVRNT